MKKIRPKSLLRILGAAAAALGAVLIYVFFPPFFKPHQVEEIPVYSKSTTRQIARELKDKKILSFSFPFKVLAKLTRVDRSLKSGLYQLAPSMSLWQVLHVLSSGKSELLTLKVPEGYTAQQIGQELEKMGVVSTADFLKAVQDPGLIAKMGVKGPSLEGFLFPQTYRVPLGASVGDLASLMSVEFTQSVGDQYAKKCLGRNLTLYQAVILASIVEKEAKTPEDQAIVAGILFNRLKLKMRLEVNATLNYVLNSKDPWLREDQLGTQSPYNTYLHRGLPPTPICNPGLTALNAVVEPADVPYLYYVAKGDGTNLYAVTFAEHQKNVIQAKHLRHLKKVREALQAKSALEATPAP
ncbi:MAG TPA: endolytic transglycosylase MltG [bacterium]|nr:endolytic transglycosylase MltG [bacterium]